MRELAAAAGASPASFTRLAQALGFDGWDGLRDALIEARRPAAPFSARVAPAGPDLPGAMLAADAARIAALDPAPLAAAAAALHEAPRIWVAGFRSCRGLALLLHYQLALFRPEAARLVGAAGADDLEFGAFAPGDAVVLFAYAPYSRASLRVADAARTAGGVLILLADSPAAPVAAGAAHLLRFDAGAGPGFFPGLAGALALAQALAATSFALGGEAALAALRASERRLSALSTFLPDPEPRR